RGHVEESRDEVDQRGLACAARTNQSHHFAGAQFQVYIVQNLMLALTGRVGEAHILKIDRLLESRERDGSRPLLHVRFGIEEGEHRGRSAHGLLEAVIEESEPAEGIVELE